MAEEWINTISNGKANYVIAVHTDKASIHAHIIADSILKDNSFWKIYWKRDKKDFEQQQTVFVENIIILFWKKQWKKDGLILNGWKIINQIAIVIC